MTADLIKSFYFLKKQKLLNKKKFWRYDKWTRQVVQLAILIHKIKKKILTDSGTSIVFEMTPESVKKAPRRPVSIKMSSIDLNRVRHILIADRDTRTQSDLRTYLHVLEYSNFKLVDNPENLLTTIQKSKDIFCFCDYRMLNTPGLELLSVPIVALTPPDSGKNIQSIYEDRIVGSLKKPIQIKDLRRILFRFMGPPLKRIAQ